MNKSFIKLVQFIVSLIFLTGISACGSNSGSDSEGKIKPETTKISGPLGDFFEVIDRGYKIVDGTLTVRLKRIAEGGPKELSFSSSPEFMIEIMDEDGDVFSTDRTGSSSRKDLEMLFSSSVDDEVSIPFQLSYESHVEQPGGGEMIVTDSAKFEKARSFRLISKWDKPMTQNGDCEIILPSQLKNNLEIVKAEKSVGDYGFPMVRITFKLKKGVNTSSMCSDHGQMWIIGVGQDEDGVDVKELQPNYMEWRTNDSKGKIFKQFLEDDPGATITLEFYGEKEGSEDVASDLKKVKKFKLKITN